MSKPIAPAIFALKPWTIKEHGGKFYIAPTAAFDDKRLWSKPYATLQRACAAIARKLAEEWLARDKRRRSYHGLKEVA